MGARETDRPQVVSKSRGLIERRVFITGSRAMVFSTEKASRPSLSACLQYRVRRRVGGFLCFESMTQCRSEVGMPEDRRLSKEELASHWAESLAPSRR